MLRNSSRQETSFPFTFGPQSSKPRIVFVYVLLSQSTPISSILVVLHSMHSDDNDGVQVF